MIFFVFQRLQFFFLILLKTKNPTAQSAMGFSIAENEGFEPSDRLRDQRFSRPPRSTTPATFRGEITKNLVWYKSKSAYYFISSFFLILIFSNDSSTTNRPCLNVEMLIDSGGWLITNTF